MAEPYVSTNSVGCATPSKSSINLTIQELFRGVNKDVFEFFGDRYFRFLEVYDLFRPKWRYALWGNQRSPADYTFLLLKDYPAIARAIGQSINWHMATKALQKAEMQMGDFVAQQEALADLPAPRPRKDGNSYIK